MEQRNKRHFQNHAETMQPVNRTSLRSVNILQEEEENGNITGNPTGF